MKIFKKEESNCYEIKTFTIISSNELKHFQLFYYIKLKWKFLKQHSLTSLKMWILHSSRVFIKHIQKEDFMADKKEELTITDSKQ